MFLHKWLKLTTLPHHGVVEDPILGVRVQDALATDGMELLFWNSIQYCIVNHQLAHITTCQCAHEEAIAHARRGVTVLDDARVLQALTQAENAWAYHAIGESYQEMGWALKEAEREEESADAYKQAVELFYKAGDTDWELLLDCLRNRADALADNDSFRKTGAQTLRRHKSSDFICHGMSKAHLRHDHESRVCNT